MQSSIARSAVEPKPTEPVLLSFARYQPWLIFSAVIVLCNQESKIEYDTQRNETYRINDDFTLRYLMSMRISLYPSLISHDD